MDKALTGQEADKPLKDLADWLGLEIQPADGFGFEWLVVPGDMKIYNMQMFGDWLLGNDGQAAIVCKLEGLDLSVLEYNYDTPCLVIAKFVLVKRGYLLEAFNGEAKTRQEALIIAVLDMLGAKNV